MEIDVVGYARHVCSYHANVRVEIWAQIAEYVPNVDAWCVKGDFNMIEFSRERIWGCHTIVHGIELAAWERLRTTLRTTDVWQHEAFMLVTDNLSFSRSDR